jgi:hypothetical protein
MKLIPQSMAMSCWYASMQMLISWKEDQLKASLARLIPPEMDDECARLRDADNGILNPQIVKLAKRIGLKAVPPLCPSPDALEGWLRDYGPLWVNGKTHIVVIAGIGKGVYGDEVLVYDPWPVNIGKIEWRNLSSWYAMRYER